MKNESNKQNYDKKKVEKLVDHIIDKMEKTSSIKHLFFFIKMAEAEEMNITYEMLKVADSRLEENTEAFLPDFVLNFMIDYLKNFSTKTILDITSIYGSVIIPVTKKLKPQKSVALLSDNGGIKLIKSFQDNFSNINWIINDTNLSLNKKERYDVIISYPHWYNINKINKKEEFTSKDGKKVIISDSEEKLSILRYLMSLEENGIALIILNPGFMTKIQKNNVFSNLEKFGLYVDAALEIPISSLSFGLGNYSGRVLFIIKRKQNSNIFIGELTENSKSRKILLKNLIKRISSPFPRLGTLIDINNFISFQNIFSKPEFNKRAKRAKLKTFSLSKISYEINTYKQKTGFVEKFNCIYLPTIGYSSVETSLEKLDIKPQNYLQIVLNDDIVDSEYLANFFNNEFGQKINLL